MWHNMDLEDNPKKFCSLLISSMKANFDYELTLPIYKVFNNIKLLLIIN